MCYMTASGDTTPSVLAGTWMGGNSALSTIGGEQKKLGGHLLKEDSWVQFAIWASSKEFAKRWFLQTIDVYFPTQINSALRIPLFHKKSGLHIPLILTIITHSTHSHNNYTFQSFSQ